MIQEQEMNRRILIIDDNPNIHKDFREILEGKDDCDHDLAEAEKAIFGSAIKSSVLEGFKIDSAFQGEEGLKMIRAAVDKGYPYALVFVDMRMPPGWDGLKTIEQIWQVDQSIQIIICTAYSDYSWGEIINRLGVSDNLLILLKPFDIAEVAQLAAALTKKWNLERQAAVKTEQLEQMVQDRTNELMEVNNRLTEMLQKVENANQELKDFTSIVSHDLKVPLRGIKTLANWILDDCRDQFSEEANEQMNLLLSRVERMYNLIDGVLRYSKVGWLEEGKIQVDLNKFIPEVIDMIVPPDNIEVIIKSTLPAIWCQETHMMQLFQNLLGNSIKYIDKPQGRVEIDCLEEQNFWKFSIADNGPGIEDKHFERIFKMFQVLSVKEEYEGTGVGLSVVKKIVELYGGKIWVESQVGQGTTFFFTLPKQEKETTKETLQTNNVG